MPITERIVYETSDGKRHDTREVAEKAEHEITVRAELAALTDEDGDRYGDYRDSDPVHLIMLNAREIFAGKRQTMPSARADAAEGA